MRTLIYKRTHPGDPDKHGRFGINDCMGRVRSWKFDAVIGIGGLGAEASSHKLDNKVNWIGIGPKKHDGRWRRGPVVTFDRFVLFESGGPNLIKTAPVLARRIYDRNVRVLIWDLSPAERKEVTRLLRLANRARPSSGRTAKRIKECGHRPTKH
jgi:hypothetical protein